MQGNMESAANNHHHHHHQGQRNVNLRDRRANALRKLEKLRMKRREDYLHLPRSTATSSNTRHRSTRIPIPPTPPAREVNVSTLTFLFEKRLKYSDIKDEGRIVVPKSYAERYMPPLESKEGFFMFMDDTTEVKIWRFRYRFWPNNASRVYVLENTSEFVKAHQLKIGDFMMIYKDEHTQRFAIGLRRSMEDLDAAGRVQGGSSASSSSSSSSGAAMASATMLQNQVWEANLQQQQQQLMLPPPAVGVVGSSSSSSSSTSSSSYANVLDDFPMHLLDMDNIEDLPEF